MKRILSALLTVLLLQAWIAAQAQSDMIIKQRAKDLRDANNAEQGVPPPAAPAAPAAPAPPPPLTPSQQQALRSVARLETDFTAIKSGADLSDDQKQTLELDLQALARSSVKPSKDTLTKLADDISTALSAANIAPQNLGQLAAAVNGYVNCSMLTPAQMQTFMAMAQTSLKSSGASDANVQTVCDDLKAVADEVQKRTPKLYQ